MGKNVTLKDLMDDLDPEIRKLIYEDTRTELNKRPHILDISYKSLLLNKTNAYTDQEFKALHNTLLEVVSSKASREFTSIEDPAVKANFTSKTPYLVYINGGPNTQLLIAKSYDAIGSFMTAVSKDPRLVDSVYGQRLKSRKEVLNRKGKPTGDYEETYERSAQLGHIGSDGEIYFTNPLIYKLGGLLDFASLSANSLLQEYVTEALNKIYNIQANIEYGFKNNAPEVLNGFENIVGSAYIVVTLQSYDKNQEFSRLEAATFVELQRKIADLANAKLRAKFYDVSGSNTLLEDIAEGLGNTIRFGKAKLKTHRTQKTKTSKQSINKSVNLPKNNGIVLKVPKPNKIVRLPSNLSNLQNLLNNDLVRQVKANMGTGASRTVLNLRSGRFAESVKVERVSESKAGMITAFYSYMKNPYATFSSGGAQSQPTSRDPKLLIAKSIREIASQQVANRLRSVAI